MTHERPKFSLIAMSTIIMHNRACNGLQIVRSSLMLSFMLMRHQTVTCVIAWPITWSSDSTLRGRKEIDTNCLLVLSDTFYDSLFVILAKNSFKR